MAKYKDQFGNITEVGNPGLNPDLIAGKTLVPDTTPLSNPSNWSTTITASSLAPGTNLTYVNPNQTPIYPVATIPQLELTQPEKESSDIIKQLQALTTQTAGESAFRTEQEKAAGISELTKTQSDLAGQLKIIQAEAQAIPLQIQQEYIGRGATRAGVQTIETGRLRENAIKALTTGALLQASQGQLSTALNLVDRAVEQRFGPVKEEIAVKLQNLDLILKDPATTLAEKRRAEQQKAIQDAQAKATAKQEADTKEIYNISVNAAQQGADSITLQKLQTARSPQEALQIAGYYLGAEFKAKLEQQKLQSDLQVATYNLSVEKFNEDARQFNLSYALSQQKQAQDELVANAKASPEGANVLKQQALTSATDLLNKFDFGKGTSVVGKFGQIVSGISWLIGGTQVENFKVQFKNLKSLISLDNVKYLKGQGQVSDAERRLLAEASSKLELSQSESEFRSALVDIQTALSGTTGIQTTDEEEELRAMGYSEEQIRIIKQAK